VRCVLVAIEGLAWSGHLLPGAERVHTAHRHDHGHATERNDRITTNPSATKPPRGRSFLSLEHKIRRQSIGFRVTLM
jgi:hypothetical protein